MVQAVEHFDRAWRIGAPSGRRRSLRRWGAGPGRGHLHAPVSANAPTLTPADPRDNDIVELMFLKGTAIVSLDSRRYLPSSWDSAARQPLRHYQGAAGRRDLCHRKLALFNSRDFFAGQAAAFWITPNRSSMSLIPRRCSITGSPS